MDFEDGAIIEEALDVMASMSGNSGQDSIIQNGTAAFEEWAENALENLEVDDLFGAIISEVGFSAFEGTHEIWSEGFNVVAEAVGFLKAIDAWMEIAEEMIPFGEALDLEGWL